MKMQEKSKGTFFVCLSAILYSLGGLFIKLIPWGGVAINGARAAIALIVITIYLVVSHQRIYLNRWVVLGSMAVGGANLLFCVANKLTTAANAIVLQFTAPVFVILIGLLVLKKRPTKLELTTCVIVFFGILFFFFDSLSAEGTLGNFIAILSGVSYAGVFFLNKLLGEDSILAVFWGSVFGLIVGIPFIAQETVFTSSILSSFVVLGVFQMGLGFVFLMIGLRNTSPVTACLVAGIEPVLNPILVAVFYHETIGAMSFVGAVIVVGSVLGYNVILSRQQTLA